MTPHFALAIFLTTLIAGLGILGWRFGVGVFWFVCVIAWLYWFAFGEIE